ncbi:hypothetical protein BJ322DRAFT_640319 [Thelephora terrestris]|uniref:Uncharacterized protein n=1 Tax=Thelephora terrestris TaxID=56493 RepID=A0A9P6HMM1_9AGAM|nr:hypothetical protein BJ322DRAFT_640319 [Thelephora terrestris]
MPPYPTRSYVRSHPSFQLNDGSDTLSPSKRSPTKRSPSKQSPSRQSPNKQSPTKRSQRNDAPSKRPKVKVMTFPALREGSVQPTPRTTDPTTPHSWNPPANEDLSRAPRKLKRASRVIGSDEGSWLATRKGDQEDVSPLTSLAPGRLSVLPEIGEAEEDMKITQREYVRLMRSREAIVKAWDQKENRNAAGRSAETGMDVDQGVSPAISPAKVRGIKRVDTEELFN